MKGPNLVSAADIRGYLGCSEYALRRRYMIQPEWPKPVTPPGTRFKDRRWLEHEVVNAVSKLRDHWKAAA